MAGVNNRRCDVSQFCSWCLKIGPSLGTSFSSLDPAGLPFFHGKSERPVNILVPTCIRWEIKTCLNRFSFQGRARVQCPKGQRVYNFVHFNGRTNNEILGEIRMPISNTVSSKFSPSTSTSITETQNSIIDERTD